jgi:hypothetical protein
MRKVSAPLLLLPLLLTTAAFAADDDSTVRWRTIVGNINDPGVSTSSRTQWRIAVDNHSR